MQNSILLLIFFARKSSFEEVVQEYEQITQNLRRWKSFVFILLGNKRDRQMEREVTQDEVFYYKYKYKYKLI